MTDSDLENIKDNYLENLVTLEKVDALYLDASTNTLTVKKENNKVIGKQEFLKIKSMYKRYRCMSNGSCKPCVERKCNSIVKEFNILLTIIKGEKNEV